MPTESNLHRFVAAVVAQEGVPFVLQGRSAFNVLDCAGVVVEPAAIAGVTMEPIAPYSLNSDYSERLIEYLERNADRVPAGEEYKHGDVLAFWLTKPKKPRHIGVVTPGTNAGSAFNFVHTSESAGRVVQNTLNKKWQDHIHSVWRLRGLK